MRGTAIRSCHRARLESTIGGNGTPKFGFSDGAWETAKQQARDILIDRARRGDTIAYSDLAARISAVTLDPHSYAMRAFLGEISTVEYNQGRGMLSAVVVDNPARRGGSSHVRMASEVVWTDPAWADLEAAAKYIARDSEAYALAAAGRRGRSPLGTCLT